MQLFLYVSKDIGMQGCPRSWVLSAGPPAAPGLGGHPARGAGNKVKAGTSGSAGWTARLRHTEDLGSPQAAGTCRLVSRTGGDGSGGQAGLRWASRAQGLRAGTAPGQEAPSEEVVSGGRDRARVAGGARGHGWPRRGGRGGRAVGGLLEAPRGHLRLGPLRPGVQGREPLIGRGAWRRHEGHQKMLRRAPGWVAGVLKGPAATTVSPPSLLRLPSGHPASGQEQQEGQVHGPISAPAKAEGQGLANRHGLCCRGHPAVQLVGDFPEAGGAHRLITLHRVVPPGGPQALRGTRSIKMQLPGLSRRQQLQDGALNTPL